MKQIDSLPPQSRTHRRWLALLKCCPRDVQWTRRKGEAPESIRTSEEPTLIRTTDIFQVLLVRQLQDEVGVCRFCTETKWFEFWDPARKYKDRLYQREHWNTDCLGPDGCVGSRRSFRCIIEHRIPSPRPALHPWQDPETPGSPWRDLLYLLPEDKTGASPSAALPSGISIC